MDQALKFVKPEGLSHTIEGGTNGTGHRSMASCRRKSGAKPSVPKGGSEAGKDFCSFSSSKLDEKRIENDSKSSEEAFVAAPGAIALGTG